MHARTSKEETRPAELSCRNDIHSENDRRPLPVGFYRTV